MSAERVLRELVASGATSGAALAARLGVTRAAVWKQVERLRELGLDIEAAAGRGYRLARPLVLLEADAIRASLSPEARRHLRALEVHFELDSTNSELLRRPRGDAHGVVCFAEHQLHGRGRRGRAWQSPLGANLYASFGWRFDGGAATLAGLSLAVGVAVVEALDRLQVPGVALKWPNDLVAQGRKLGGVLIELGGEIGGPCDAVVGVGINVAMPPSAATAIDQPWTDVATLAPAAGRGALATALVDAMLPALARFEREGYAAFRAAYDRADALRGVAVTVDAGRERVAGVALGVDESGLLRVKVGDAERRYASGEVSVRAT